MNSFVDGKVGAGGWILVARVSGGRARSDAARVVVMARGQRARGARSRGGDERGGAPESIVRLV